MSERLPVSIVTGYLGAGKTTLVNNLLAQDHGRRIMVLVNDFGEVAIDEDLIVSRDGDTIALANGCMCCSLGDDLFDALDRILHMRPLPDHLVIETSGVADPDKIRQIALAEPMLDHRGIVTVVDPVNLALLLADRVLCDTVTRQLAAASLIIVSKADLCDDDEIAQAEAAWRPHARKDVGSLLGARDVPAEVLLGELEIGTHAPSGRDARSHHHHRIYSSWTRQMSGPVSREALAQFLARDDLGIYRLKGFVELDEKVTVVVQKAGKLWSVDEIHTLTPPPALRIVAIGRSDLLDLAKMEQAIQAVRSDLQPPSGSTCPADGAALPSGAGT